MIRVTVRLTAGLMMTISLYAQTVLVVQEGLNQVTLFSAANPAERKVVAIGSKPHEIELTPDGRTAFVTNFGLLEANHKEGSPGRTISVLDVVKGVERTRFNMPAFSSAPHGLKLRPPEYRELFTNAEEGDGRMAVFDARTGMVRRTFVLPEGVHNFVFNRDGSGLFIFTMGGEVLRIDPDSGKVLARVEAGSPRGLGWTADGRSLIVSGKGEVVLLDPVSLAIVKRMAALNVGQVFYPAATPDGKWILAPAVLDGVVVVIDALTGLVAHRIETGSPLLVSFAGSQAWVSNVKVPAGMFGPSTAPKDGGVVVVDLETFATRTVQEIVDANGVGVTAK